MNTNTNLIDKIEAMENEIETLKSDLLFASAGKAIRFMEQNDENVIISLTIDGGNIGLINEPEKHLDWCIRAVRNKPSAFMEIPLGFRSRVFSKLESPSLEETCWFVKSAPSKLWEEGIYRELIPDEFIRHPKLIRTIIEKWFFWWIE